MIVVPQLLAHFEENHQFYLVQEFVVGHSLSAELQPGQIWTEAQVVELLQEVLGILEVVHAHGMIHRDIKPSNLLRRHQDGRLVLIDFGSVKQVGTQVVTAQGQTSGIAIGIPATLAIGTVGYMPAEQWRGRPRPNSDIYALGMIGIQALTGLPPTQLLQDADTGEIIWQPQIYISFHLTSVLTKWCVTTSKDRYQSATEVLQALQLPATLLPTHADAVSVTAPSQNQAQFKQDTIPIGQGRAITQLSDAAPSSPHKYVLLGITMITSVTLMVGSYYSWRSPVPTSQIPQKVTTPTPNTALGNITLAKTLSGHLDSVWVVALSPDGQTLASGSQDQTIKLWHLATGRLSTFAGHSGAVWSIAFSPDGQTLASASSDNTIKLWNLNSGRLRTLTGHSGAIWSIAFSPDGQTLASGSSDNTIKLWNLNSGRLRTLTGHSGVVRSIALSPDGQTLASGSSDNTIKLWSLSSGKLRRTFLGHTNRVLSVALSPDSQILASGSVDKTVKIWHLNSGKLLHTLSGNSHWANSVAISPDGRTVAGGIGDIVKIWDLNTGKLLHKLSGHSSDITSISFTANGIVSGSRDKTIKIWQFLSKPK